MSRTFMGLMPTYGRDGTYHLTSIPPHIDEDILRKATAYGRSIIETALSSLKPLFTFPTKDLQK